MNSLDKMRTAKEFLEKSGIEDAIRDAELIISHCLGIDRVTLYRDNPGISDECISTIDEFLKRRAKREPLQYILGCTEFFGLKIKTGKGVLIPRPETELLVEEAIKTVRSLLPPHPPLSKGGQGGGNLSSFILHPSSLTILDLCTGCGCIALALAGEFPDAQVYGTDKSEIAIKYAKENADINVVKNVIFIKGSLFEPIRILFTVRSALGGPLAAFNLIVSNPPYIRRDDIKNLQPEIKEWEPVEALDGGEDGLDYYRAIIPEARNYLTEGGCLIFELGIGQADIVRKMVEDAGFINISLIKDYAGIERILIAK